MKLKEYLEWKKQPKAKKEIKNGNSKKQRKNHNHNPQGK